MPTKTATRTNTNTIKASSNILVAHAQAVTKAEAAINNNVESIANDSTDSTNLSNVNDYSNIIPITINSDMSTTPMPDSTMNANTDNIIDSRVLRSKDEELMNLLKEKYGEIPLILTRDDVYRLANSKTVNFPVVVLLYMLHNFGTDHVMNGSTMFDEVGGIAHFALRYGLDPDQVGRAIPKISTAINKWESIRCPTQLSIPFEFDTTGNKKSN